VLDLGRTELRHNTEWFDAMPFEEVLRLAARMTVAQMLQRDTFQERMQADAPIGIHELLYPLMQGWDSVMVQADVELGGTDQLWNLLLARQLQQQEGQAPQVALTTPLLVGLDGEQKMSKSLGNYVGIAEPPAEQFGKLMSIPDDRLPEYSRYAAEPVGEALAFDATRPPVESKRALARAVVDRYHGAGAGEAAEAEFDRVFKSHDAPTNVPEHDARALADSADGDGRVRVSSLLVATGLASSGKDGKRLIEQGGVR
jgi:tyrosyl-tRNA synthetase